MAAIVLAILLPASLRANGVDERPILVGTLAGASQAGNRDGPAREARFEVPMGVAVARDGTVYVSDAGSNTVRAIAPSGIVRTVAGGAAGYQDGPALKASFRHPTGLAVANDGSLYIADGYNRAIRRLAGGMVRTVAGGPTKYGSADGAADSAQFMLPNALTLDKAGNLYVADFGNGVRKIAHDGTVTTLLGIASKKVTGVSCAGRVLYVASAAGITSIDTVSENVTAAMTIEESSASRTAAPLDAIVAELGQRLGYPYAITALDDRQIAYTDLHNNTIHFYAGDHTPRVIAGASDWDPPMFAGGFEDGDAMRARFYSPVALALRPDGSLVVADAGNHRIRTVSLWDRTSYVDADGYQLDRFMPHQNDDGIAWLGTSQAFWDTTWFQSTQGELQRQLESSPFYKGRLRHPRVIPMAFPAADLPALTNAIQTYFINGMVKAVVLEFDEGFHSTPDEETALLRSIDSTLRANHVTLIVLLTPEGWRMSPSESLAFQTQFLDAVPANYTDAPYVTQSYATMVSAVKASGARYYDARPEFERAERLGEGPLFGTIDPHLSPRGRALLAKVALRALAQYFLGK